MSIPYRLPWLLVVLCTSPVLADNPDRYDADLDQKRFNLRLGAFLIDPFDTEIRLDSDSVPLGAVIDLEDGFNVASRKTVARIDGWYRFNKKHRLEWTYYRAARDGMTVTDQEFTVGDPSDPDGEVTIPVGATVDLDYDFDLYKVGWAWSFLNKRRYEAFIGLGLNVRDFSIELDYRADLAGNVEQDQVEAKAPLPLPSIVLGARWDFSPRLQSHIRYEIFFLSISGYSGSQQDFQALIEYDATGHFGFGAGINAVDLNLGADFDDFRGELSSRTLGLLGYLKFYF